MKLTNNQIDNFINDKVINFDATLIYGPDQGIVTERKSLIIKKILGDKYDPFLLTKFDSADLAKNPHKLYNELGNISLISGRKVIVIYNANNNLHKVIETSLEDKKSDDLIIILAEELAASSKLRKFFESKKNIVAIPCYADDLNMRKNIIRQSLAKFNISNDIIDYIAHHISGNRLILRQEIRKLQIFCLNGNKLDSENIADLLCDNANNDFQNFANAIADKNPAKAIAITEELLANSIAETTLLRVLINYLQRILESKYLLQAHNNYDNAIRYLKPPVFFKQKDILRRHLNLWQEEELKIILQKLVELELTCKKYSNIKANILLKFFTLIISNKK